MLTREDNELLVRTGPGTPTGALFRRFWTPIMLASELGEAESTPVRVRVLGEELVAFRNTDGQIGLLDAYCPHRRANLFWGRNEDRGLRCVYHGWKFDVDGQCVDLPNALEGPTLKNKVRTRAYPTIDRGGLIWSYLGPAEVAPPFPNIVVFDGDAPASHRHHTKVVVKGNWLQHMEGDVDSSHVSFLHSALDSTPSYGSRLNEAVFADPMPRWFPEETPYGLELAAQRDAGPSEYYWRVNQFLFPYMTLVASPPDVPLQANVRVPIDDETTMSFRCFFKPDGPLNDDELALLTGGVFVPEVHPGTFEMKECMENDYLIDRELQRTKTFTGIKSVPAQDLAVIQNQGPGFIADRSREYLVSSDRAIILLRKRFLNAVKALQNGIEPPEAFDSDSYDVRPTALFLPRGVVVHEASDAQAAVR